MADQLERNDGYQASVGGLAIGSDTDAQVEATRAAAYSGGNTEITLRVHQALWPNLQADTIVKAVRARYA